VKAGVNELHADITEQELEQMAQKDIEHQIRHTFQTAFEKGVDIYNLGESLYRKNPHEWRRIASGKQHFVLNKDSMRNINVTVHIVYPGRYKFSP
jgi:spore germination protein KC